MVLAHWNNRSEVYMSLHSDTLSWLPPPISPVVMIWMKCDEKCLIIPPQLTSELPVFLVWFSLWCLTPLSTIFHIMLYWEHLVWAWFELTTLVAIGTDWTGSWKSNYHTIMTTTAPARIFVKILRTIVLIALFLISHSLVTSLNIYPKSFQSLGHFQNLQANGLENASNWNPGTYYMYMQVFNNKKKKEMKFLIRSNLY